MCLMNEHVLWKNNKNLSRLRDRTKRVVLVVPITTMTEAANISTNTDNKGDNVLMHSILAHTIIGSTAVISVFTQMSELLFEIYFIDKNDGNMNNSKIWVNTDMAAVDPIIVCARMLCMRKLFTFLSALVAMFAASVMLVICANLSILSLNLQRFLLFLHSTGSCIIHKIVMLKELKWVVFNWNYLHASSYFSVVWTLVHVYLHVFRHCCYQFCRKSNKKQKNKFI